MTSSLDLVFLVLQPFSIGLAIWAFVSLLLSLFPMMYGFRSVAYINAAVAYGLIALFRFKASAIATNWSLVFASDRIKSALVFGAVGWIAAWGLDWAQTRFPLMPRWGFFLQLVVLAISVLFLVVSVQKHLPV